uniref:Protein KAKU4 n=1 Tax=Ananas comosus var. bracteatus TaxID=296719 RepID=A0A6V7QSH7_ANACO
MSSLFVSLRSDHHEEKISGDEAAPPPPSAQSETGGWLSGLISGAGKLISSVIGPDYSSSSSLDSSDDDDDDDDVDLDEDQVAAVSSKKHDELILGGQDTRVPEVCMERSLAIVSEIESKYAIEQLLMQESFSREECDKLVKIIQSRVVDCGPSELGQIGVEKELSLIASGTDTAVPLAWYKGELPKRISYSSGSPNIHSPEPFFHRELAPDFHDKAVTEAKKWLEAKRTSSSPKSRFDYARCSLNTDMFHADFEGQISSPSEMAKSYIRSLPQSPSFGGIRYKSTPPCGVPLVKEETTNMRHPAHSSKVLKRSQETSVSEVALDNSQRVSIRPTGNLLSISKFTKVNFPSGYSDNEASRIPSEAGQGGIEEALLGINNYTNCSSMKRSFDEALNLSFKNHNTSVAPVETPILTALPLGPIPYQVGRYPIFPDSIFLAPDKHKDPQEPSLVNKQVWNASTPLDSHAMAIKQEEHDEFVLDDSSSVPKLMLKEDIDAAPCSSPEQRTEHPVGYKRRRRCSAETTSCHQTNSCRGRLGNGDALKENQQMLIEGQASTGRTRGRKAVARPGRGRGKMR